MTNEEAIRGLQHIRGAIRCGIPPTKPGKAIEAIDIAISALSHDRWISVEERLPEPETEVMVAFDDGAVWCLWQNWQNDDCDPFTYSVDTFDGPTHDVTHWMPLPEPPKEETNRGLEAHNGE